MSERKCNGWDWIIAHVDEQGNACFEVVPPPEICSCPKNKKQALQKGVDESVLDYLRRVADRVVPQGRDWKFIRAADIPEKRTFRSAWSLDVNCPECLAQGKLCSLCETDPAHRKAVGRELKVDMSKARQIHLDRLRVKRNEKLKSLDIAYLQAVEGGDTAKAKSVAAQKQALRDLPVNAGLEMEAISSPDELENFEPLELREE